MLYFLAVWSLLLLGCSVIGIGVLNALHADAFDQAGDRWIAAIWLGVLLLAIALLAMSIWLPLSPLVGGLVAVVLSVPALVSSQSRAELLHLWQAQSRLRVIGWISVAVAIAALTSRQVTWVDTGLYHHSVIEWLAQFGSVPGLALLFANFGFTSSWFALAAPLNPEVVQGHVSAVTNGFAFLIAVISACICAYQIANEKARLSDWFLLVFSSMMLPIVVGFSLFATILVSPSPDIPIIFLIAIVAWSVLVTAAEVTTASRWVTLMLAAGAVTVKLIAIPVLGVAVLYYLLAPNRLPSGLSVRRWVLGGAIVVLLLAPLLVAGTITSGCPLYPSAALCLDLPWSPSKAVAKGVAQSTHGWTSWYGKPPTGVNPWLWLFWKWAGSERPNQLMVVLMLVTAGGFGYGVAVDRVRRSPGVLWVGAIAVFGAAFLMLTSPFFRFCLTFLLVIPALLIAFYLANSRIQLVQWAINWLARPPRQFTLLPLVLATVITVGLVGRSPAQLLLPPRIQTVPLVQKRVNDVLYWSPQSTVEVCWATPPPCAFQVPEDVRLREPNRGIAAGFVHAKRSP